MLRFLRRSSPGTSQNVPRAASDPRPEESSRRRFWKAIAFGLLSELVLYAVHDWQSVQGLQNVCFDAVVRAQTAFALDVTAPGLPIVFIDIDERSWRNPIWGGGEPLESPRDALIDLIRFSVKAGAAATVVDIELTKAHPDAADRQFAHDLSDIATSLDDSRDPAINRRIILVRDPAPVDDHTAQDELEPSILDDTVGGAEPTRHIFYAAPFFTLSPGDRVLRDWEMWHVTCRHRGTGSEVVILPSVQLLAIAAYTAYANDSSAPWRTPGSSCPLIDTAQQKTFDSSLTLELDAWINRQPLFRDHHHAADLKSSMTDRIAFRTPDAGLAPANLRRTTDILRISALDVLTRPELQRHILSDQDWRHAVVIIGQSHRAARDIYLTPLGDMTGALVIANSVNSLVRFGPLHEPPEWVHMAISIAVLLFGAWLAVKLPDFLAVVFLAGVLLIAFGIFAVTAYHHGMFVDIAAPLMGILVGEMAEYGLFRLGIAK